MQTQRPSHFQTVTAVYLSGMLAGIALILFPSAGTLFTDADFHNLSGTQFGVLFTPQIITAIVASFATASLARRTSMKRVLQIGLWCTTIAMALLFLSQWVIGTAWVFPVLLAATGAIGAGFGFAISALNAYAFDLFPGREDSAVTAIHVMTGIGQVGAALILSLFVGLDLWWGAPMIIAFAVVLMLGFQSRLALQLRTEADEHGQVHSSVGRRALPLRVWLFALVTFAYGAIEGTFGNWTPIYLQNEAALSMADAALGLSLFWASITLGRVLFAVVATRLNVKPLFFLTPIVSLAVLALLPSLDGQVAHYVAIVMAGLALSYFFPYAISLASAEYPLMTAAVSGSLVAGLQFGNGISANVVGFASASISFATIFQWSGLYAALMAGLVVYLGITRRKTDSTVQSDLHIELPCQPMPCPQLYSKQEAT